MGKSLIGKRLKRLGLFCVGVFLSFSLWAQTGVICGTVTDAKIKEPLIGASVVIEGTTVGAITAVSYTHLDVYKRQAIKRTKGG